MLVLKTEDGLICSVGLGSNLVPELSLVVDDLGIYFDAQGSSRLESILQTATLRQADELIAALVTANVGKYNVGQGGFFRFWRINAKPYWCPSRRRTMHLSNWVHQP